MVDGFTFRRATREEVAAAGKQIDYAFNEEGGEGFGVQPEWTLFAFDEDRIAATGGAYPFEMGFEGQDIRCAGVTIITTEPEYRRRGLVREISTQLLHRAKDDGRPVAGLWASMGALYQRYGYGLASSFNTYQIDPKQVVFREDLPSDLSVRRMGADEAVPLIKETFSTFLEGGTLTLGRDDWFWEELFLKREKEKRHFAICLDTAGKVRGYSVYRLGSFKRDTFGPDMELSISDFVWLDLEAYRSLWRYYAAHDLAGRLKFWFVPEDDPAKHLLLEPRALNQKVSDGVWLRVIDAADFLARRGYVNAGSVSLEIVGDDICPWNNGELTVSSEGAGATGTVHSGGAKPLSLSINTLATLASGHTSASSLTRMGKITGGDAATLREADRLFATTRRPWCPHEF